MPKIYIYIVLFLVCCWIISGTIANGAEISYNFGQDTFIHSINRTDSGNSYSIKEIAVRMKNNFEFSLINHEYHIRGIRDFDCLSFGIIYHWTWEYKWLYADLSLGFRYAEKNRDIKWLMHKHLLADFGGSVGIKYKGIKFGYTLRHFSAPGNDTGENLDQLTLIIKVPF